MEDLTRPHSGPAAAARAITLISRSGMYLDPINEHRFAYLRGEIDVYEFERRVGHLLGVDAETAHTTAHDNPEKPA